MLSTILPIASTSPQSELSEMLSDLVQETLSALEQITDHDLRYKAHCDLCAALENPSVIQSMCNVQTVISNYHLILFTPRK